MFKVPKKLLSLFIVVFHGIIWGTVIDSYLHHPDLPTTMHFKVPLWWYSSMYVLRVIGVFIMKKMAEKTTRRALENLPKLPVEKTVDHTPTVWQTSSNPPKPNTP